MLNFSRKTRKRRKAVKHSFFALQGNPEYREAKFARGGYLLTNQKSKSLPPQKWGTLREHTAISGLPLKQPLEWSDFGSFAIEKRCDVRAKIPLNWMTSTVSPQIVCWHMLIKIFHKGIQPNPAFLRGSKLSFPRSVQMSTHYSQMLTTPRENPYIQHHKPYRSRDCRKMQSEKLAFAKNCV